MSQTFAQLFEESIAKQDHKVGDLVQAEVIEANGDYILVTAGLKSEAEISMDQFKTEDGNIEVNVGDNIEVVIEALEDGLGHTRLSFERARRMRAWEELETAHDDQEIVIGRITGRVKGGFTVAVKDIRAFLPGSLVDVRPTKDSTYLEGRDLEFKVIKIDRVRNNIVVSRRAVVEHELSAEREELLANLEEGMNVKGYVKNLTEYGAFINLGGLDGLLHITDMSWKRIKHPSEMLEVGQEIEARVLKFDKERQRVSLGLKQMGEDPWSDLQRRYPEGARINGTVTNLTDYGVFVEIEEGVEGLVHVSEMDWTNKNVHPSKLVAVGDEVEVMVLDVDTERRRISLGMKQCTVNPWEAFAATRQKGEKLSGQIKSITDFGVFVGLDGGIDGLIHLSDLSWDRPGEEVVREFKKGDEVEVVVLAVDAERERISLGLKQASGDPFSQYVTENGKGAVVKGKVISVDARSAVVELVEGVEGQLRASELSTDRVEDASTVLKEGDEVEAKITSIERKTRRISLSIKAIELDAQGEILEEYSRPKSSTNSLGDKLRETLEQNDSE